MRHITKRIALLTAALMAVSCPVLADEMINSNSADPAQQGGKAECLLVAVNSCELGVTPQNRIDMIQTEINKGTAVYNDDELRILNNELNKALSDLNDAYGGGG